MTEEYAFSTDNPEALSTYRETRAAAKEFDGDSLDIDDTVPVGEVLRMLYEFHEDVVERAFLSRSASEPGA